MTFFDTERNDALRRMAEALEAIAYPPQETIKPADREPDLLLGIDELRTISRVLKTRAETLRNTIEAIDHPTTIATRTEYVHKLEGLANRIDRFLKGPRTRGLTYDDVHGVG